MCLDNLILMASSSRVGTRMSVNLGLCVGGGFGDRAGDLWRGLGAFRSAREGIGRDRRRMGRSGVADLLAVDRASVRCDNLQEWKFWLVKKRQSRVGDDVVGLRDVSCLAASGGRRMKIFSGFDSTAGCPQSSVWPVFNHSWGESARIMSSRHQEGPVDNTDPPPLFMGNQLKRFSHFRDGIVHWCRYLEVKEDVRNQGQEVLVREEQCSSAGQIVQDPSADVIDTNSSDTTVICFDIETTGFSATNDRIIEFAARDLAGGVCSTIETLVNPQREVMNAHVHHISTRMVNNAGVPKWKDVALALVDFVKSRRKGQGLVILVAHNGKRFDVPFIMNECDVCGVSIPSYWRFADTLPLARMAMKRSGIIPVPKTSLADLVFHYKIESDKNAHRAMADVNMLSPVLERLMNDLDMSTADLLEQSFSADDIVLKGKDSKKEIIFSSNVVDKEELDTRELADKVNNAGSGSVPWDLMKVDSTGRSNEDEFETKLGVSLGQVWNPARKQFPGQDGGPSFQMPDVGGLESGPNTKIIVQRIRRAGATPLMRNPPRVVRTPAVRPKKLDVNRDITTS